MKNLLGEEISESEIQAQIMQALSWRCIVFRANVAKFKFKNNDGSDRWVSTGLPKGFPDLFGFRKKDGKMFFIEVKNAKGRLSKDQKIFAAWIKDFDVLYGVARSIDEALEIVEV